jgi:8-oxo-dGTP diphosphatase
MPLTSMCLCFLLRTDASGHPEVLLGRKNQGFGQGKVVGPGGHIEPGEDALTAAAREVKEETGLVVDPAATRQLASISFRFPARPDWDQHADVFVATRWTGQLAASDELTPAWHRTDAVPYGDMWDDARQWLPQVLAGQQIRAEFRFAGDNETVDATTISAVVDPTLR